MFRVPGSVITPMGIPGPTGPGPKRTFSETRLAAVAPQVAAIAVPALEILLAEDNDDVRGFMKRALESLGHRVTVACDGAAAMVLLGRRVFDIVITDVRLPYVDGMALFRHLRRSAVETDVILMTAHAAFPDAVDAMREGACDYLVKPIGLDDITARITRIAARRAAPSVEAIGGESDNTAPSVIGESPAMERVRHRIEKIAQSSAPVLITGETGTGKELVARLLHLRSPRSAGPFVAVNCAAFPDTLFEAELFGHERGAFTGAVKKRLGRFMAADGGTLLIDEVGEISLSAQVKLLRVLQEGTIEPLGADESVRVDVRVLASTHRDLKKCVSEGTFREDLYYRLNVLDVWLPPLRERRDDLPRLVEYFLRKFTPGDGPVPPIAPRAWGAIVEHSFPGNVRELAHAIEHACILSAGAEIDLEDLPADVVGAIAVEAERTDTSFRSLHDTSFEFEREYLLRALRLADGKRMRAAALLGISRRNLWEKLAAHGLSDWDPTTDARAL